MRTRLIGWLRRLADWLEGTPPNAVVTCARRLVRDQYWIPGRSGEAKRHQVYAQLLKQFPAEDHRRLSMAIERALEMEEPR